MSIEAAVALFFKYVFMPVLGIFTGILTWIFKNERKRVDKHSEDISKLKEKAVSEDKVRQIVANNAVSEDKVRQIVTESIQLGMTPIAQSVMEIKEIVRSSSDCINQLQSRMAKIEGYQEAIRELKSGD